MRIMYGQEICARFQYPVVFTRGLFTPQNNILGETLRPLLSQVPVRALLFVDDGLLPHFPGFLESLSVRLRKERDWLELVHEPVPVPGGEAIKNDYRLIMGIVDACLEHRLCRHSLVLAMGGGAVLDAVGFAASLIHRGLRVVRFPTTTLSQGDSGVGVKTGMNLHGGKNTIGTFWPPFAVLNDLDFLRTLPFEHWISGVAEAFKVGLVKDAALVEFLCHNATALRERDESVMARVVIWSARLHLEHIRDGGDPFELGEARPLDFGHWVAHKLESMSGFSLPHGHAVAIGLAVDLVYARLKGWLPADDVSRILSALGSCGLPVSSPLLQQRQADGRLRILDGLEEFREHQGGRLVLIYPDGLGRMRRVHAVDTALLETAVEFLVEAAQPH